MLRRKSMLSEKTKSSVTTTDALDALERTYVIVLLITANMHCLHAVPLGGGEGRPLEGGAHRRFGPYFFCLAVFSVKEIFTPKSIRNIHILAGYLKQSKHMAVEFVIAREYVKSASRVEKLRKTIYAEDAACIYQGLC